jgi:integrase
MLKVTKRKDRKTYLVLLEKIGGTRKTFKTYEQARKFADMKWKEYIKDQYIPTTVSGFKGIAEWYSYQKTRYTQGEFLRQELRHKENIAEKFAKIIVQGKTIEQWDLDKLVTHPRSPASISQEIISQVLSMDISHKTMKGLYYSFKNIFTFFHERKWTHENAIGSTMFPKQKHGAEDNKAIRISKENIEKIISHAKPEYKLVIKFAAFTGLRQGELRELRWKDINFDNNTITISRSIQLFGTIGHTKTKNGQRIVPLIPSIAQELKELRMASGRPEDEQLVFVGKDGKRIYGQTLRDNLDTACLLGKVARIKWHDLRHFYASILLQTYGDDLHKVTSFMGHGSIEMTRKVYGHWLDDKKRNAEDAAKLDAAFNL